MGDIDLIAYSHWARNLRGLADTTIRVRIELLERLTAYVGVPLRDVQPGHILRFERAAIAGRAPETRRAYACHIRAFYRWAKAAGVVSEDPSEVLTLPSVPRHLPRPIEEEDLAFALAEAQPKMAAVLTLAAYAGLRSCEIAGLEWSDLRREQDGTVFLHVRHGKGHKERTVEVGQVVLRALHRYGVKRRGAMFYGNGRAADQRSVDQQQRQSLSGSSWNRRHHAPIAAPFWHRCLSVEP
jgi:integrase